MAQKEATVFLVDIDASMGRVNPERGCSDLQWVLQYVYDQIASRILTGRKTLYTSVIAVHGDDSAGSSAIRELVPLKTFDYLDLKTCQFSLRPSRGKAESGCMLEAVQMAVESINSHCRRLKYVRKIVVLTNGETLLTVAGLAGSPVAESIIRDATEYGIQIQVLGVDFDDASNGYSAPGPKSAVKRATEAEWASLLSQIDNSVYATYLEAFSTLSVPQVKSVTPVRLFSGLLTLGQPDDDENASLFEVDSLSVQIEGYPGTKRALPIGAKTFCVPDEGDSGAGGAGGAGGAAEDKKRPLSSLESKPSLHDVKLIHEYVVHPRETPSATAEPLIVDTASLSHGYKYGRDIVFMNAEEQAATRYQTFQALEIIHFGPLSSLRPWMGVGESVYITGGRESVRSQAAVASIAQALAEVDCYAFARFVRQDGGPIQLVALLPVVDVALKCLVMVKLPFAEDLKLGRFPLLTRVFSTSGKDLGPKHPRLPTQEMCEAMDVIVEMMELDLTDPEAVNESGIPEQEGSSEVHSPKATNSNTDLTSESELGLFTVEDSFNPLVHRLADSVKAVGIEADTEQLARMRRKALAEKQAAERRKAGISDSGNAEGDRAEKTEGGGDDDDGNGDAALLELIPEVPEALKKYTQIPEKLRDEDFIQLFRRLSSLLAVKPVEARKREGAVKEDISSTETLDLDDLLALGER